jgi:hypothetical protein
MTGMLRGLDPKVSSEGEIQLTGQSAGTDEGTSVKTYSPKKDATQSHQSREQKNPDLMVSHDGKNEVSR